MVQHLWWLLDFLAAPHRGAPTSLHWLGLPASQLAGFPLCGGLYGAVSPVLEQALLRLHEAMWATYGRVRMCVEGIRHV